MTLENFVSYPIIPWGFVIFNFRLLICRNSLVIKQIKYLNRQLKNILLLIQTRRYRNNSRLCFFY